MNDAIAAAFVAIERDGAAMRVYTATPAEADASTPTIVMAMHIFGIDSGQREVAERLARAGFATVIPDLYARYDAPDGDAVVDPRAFVALARGLSFKTVDPDIRAAAAWIRKQYPRSKSAILGFCMGGTIAMYRTAGYSEIFSAAAVWYGLHPDVAPESVDIPIVASFGEKDAGIPVERVEAFRAGLRVPHDIKVYPNAQHAFFDQRDAHDPVAAEDSWQRTVAFLNHWLR